jgi:hypothetical protein
MSFTRILLAASTIALLAGGAAYTAEPAAAPAPTQNDGRGMMRGMFTPEERMMLFVDGQRATAGRHDRRPAPRLSPPAA